MGNSPLLLSRMSVTSAKLSAFRESLPANMISSIFAPRRDFADCSPRTHRIASVILLFPLPLGPTTAVTPGTKSTPMRSANDLKPIISSLFRNTFSSLLQPADSSTLVSHVGLLPALLPFSIYLDLFPDPVLLNEQPSQTFSHGR